ncbi:MAG: Ig-like domain-containing protein [Planctomycetota bacterium]|jgi:hypothetical protein
MNRPGNRQRGSLPTFEALEPRLLLDAVREPWVAGVTDTTVYVCLEATLSTPDAVVDYGQDASYGMTATTENTQWVIGGANTVHNIKLTGLLPNSQYHYCVTHGSTTSADYTFWTAPEAGEDAKWGFAADCQSGTSVHNSMAALIDSHDPRMMVYGGDLVSTSDYARWDSEWFVANQVTLNTHTPFVNATGNHEGWHYTTQAFTQSPEGDGENGLGYFSFDYGDAHILILHTNPDWVDQGPTGDQWQFAAADLAATTKPFKIVAYHKPAYVTWYNPSTGKVEEGGISYTRDITTQVFEPNGVDMILNGHYHFYQHNLVNGIRHMIVAPSGGALDTPSPGAYTLTTEKTNCFCIIETTPTTLTLSAYRGDGSLIESVVLYHDPTPPTVPTGLSATAISDAEMWLTWDESTDPETGVDHYNIYRDGQLVGATTQTCYSDGSLSELTSYTYEVSAVNPDDVESGKSDPVTKTTLANTAPPEITVVWSVWLTEVEVMFSEPVEQASAESPGSYSIDQGVSITSATLQGDNRTVKLITSALSQATTYTLTVNNVRDLAATPNTIAADSQATFEHRPWSNQDVGSPSLAGSMSYSGGQYTIKANGHDIFDGSDDFHFVYRTLDGDGEIICRAVNDTNLWAAKSGVMIRDTLNGNSPEVAMVFGHQVNAGWYQTRYTTGGTTYYSSASGVTAPEYTKVIRSNGEFTGYISTDGETWTQVGGATAPGDMVGGTVYWGLCACSHSDSTLGTFLLDNVKVVEYAPNAAPAAAADGYAVNQEAHLNVAPAGGVLANDTDADGDELSAVLVSGVSHGTVELYANGSFGYTPDEGYYGPDSFTYMARDARASSSAVTVTIQVAQIGNIPGDANLDDLVDTQDFTILKANLGESGVWGDGDFNSDRFVDTQEFTILKAYIGQSASSGGGGQPLGSTDLSQAAPAGSQTTEQLPWPAVLSPRPQAPGRPRWSRPAQPQGNLVEWIKPVGGLELPARPAGGFVDLPAAATFALPADDSGAAESDGSSLAINLDPGLLDVLASLYSSRRLSGATQPYSS